MDLVDTDVLIDVQRNHPPALAWFTAVAVPPAIPGFVAMELIQDARNANELRQAQLLIAPLHIVWPSESDCQRAMSLFATYHLSHNLGLIDSLIAACAMGLNARLFTFNAKHYGAIPGLIIGQPYVR
jgi:predicted nucleic acid-binding protein